jgi:UTP--glucose-1-phosphate uridylyltransferase
MTHQAQSNIQKPPVTKAVITSGGFGSRLLPITAGICKEMLPLIDKPFIHLIIEQCLEAGVSDIIIVTKQENLANIQSYFTKNQALIDYLESKDKIHLLKDLLKIQTNCNFTYVIQDESLPYGNARPLVSAKAHLTDCAFIYSYGDDLIYGSNNRGSGMVELVETYNNSDAQIVLMCTEVEESKIPSVGIIELKPDKIHVERIIEKPKLQDAPSNLASVASYIFTPEIFTYLDPQDDFGVVGEFYIQKGIDIITHQGSTVACITNGDYLTCGDPKSYYNSIIRVAKDRNDI